MEKLMELLELRRKYMDKPSIILMDKMKLKKIMKKGR